jgi:prolyl oligopeptidase
LKSLALFRLGLIALAAAGATAQALDYPATEKKPVTDTLQGVQVTEDYRWLENAADPAVKAWTAEQLKVARGVLDAVPARPGLRERFREILGTAPLRYFAFYRRGSFFALKSQPPKSQPFLVVMKSAGDVASERVLLDPTTLDAKGTTAIDFYVPSLDGKFVAVSLSEGGSEDGSVHVFDASTGKALADVVPRVQYPTGGGSVEWNEKGTGFYYTRYPQGGERAKEDVNFYQQVWFHKLGTKPEADLRDRQRIRASPRRARATLDGRRLASVIATATRGEYAFLPARPRWQVDEGRRLRRQVREHGTGLRRGSTAQRSVRRRAAVLAMPIDSPSCASGGSWPQGDVSIRSIARRRRGLRRLHGRAAHRKCASSTSRARRWRRCRPSPSPARRLECASAVMTSSSAAQAT